MGAIQGRQKVAAVGDRLMQLLIGEGNASTDNGKK